MKKFQVITDSTSDVSKDFREELNLDYAPMVVALDNKEYTACLDWSEISPADFYNAMRKGAKTRTVLVPTGVFEEKFEKYLSQGLDVLYIACSSKLSGSVNNAKIVASELKDKYPNNKVVCIDSLRSNYAEGMIALTACKMANEGKNIDEVASFIEEEKLKYQTFASVGSLHWLKEAGRIKASAAFFGNLLGVKPIILGDAKGYNFAYKKVKGRKTSLDDIIATIKDRIHPNSPLFIEHADCQKDAEYIKEQLKEQVKDIYVSNLGPIIGSTVGPDTFTVNFYGKKVEIATEE